MLIYMCFYVYINLLDPHSRRTTTRKIVEMYIKRNTDLKKWFLADKQELPSPQTYECLK